MIQPRCDQIFGQRIGVTLMQAGPESDEPLADTSQNTCHRPTAARTPGHCDLDEANLLALPAKLFNPAIQILSGELNHDSTSLLN